MKTTFKVSYYLRSNYENKERKSPVMLRMYLGGEKIMSFLTEMVI